GESPRWSHRIRNPQWPTTGHAVRRRLNSLPLPCRQLRSLCRGHPLDGRSHESRIGGACFGIVPLTCYVFLCLAGPRIAYGGYLSGETPMLVDNDTGTALSTLPESVSCSLARISMGAVSRPRGQTPFAGTTVLPDPALWKHQGFVFPALESLEAGRFQRTAPFASYR